MRRPLFTWPRALVLTLLVVGGILAALWLVPSKEYLFVPDRTRLVEPLVSVANEKPRPDANGAGIYMVDILVRRANVLERLLPFTRKDGTLVPKEAFNPEGVSDEQKAKSDALVMSQSQRVAEAVALRALGYDVNVTPSGAQISLVVPGSPADQAGLQPGDVIVEANGQKVTTPEELRGALLGIRPGTKVPLTIRRSGGLKDLTVGTTADRGNPKRAILGVIVEQAASMNLPVKVSINAGDIGGPSAGLAFALDIVDELGPDVDKGRRVVVTGELNLDGQVEAIGGIKQKAISARQAGADVFVVPDGNSAEARKYAGNVEILPVGTFDEALQGLGVGPLS